MPGVCLARVWIERLDPVFLQMHRANAEVNALVDNFAALVRAARVRPPASPPLLPAARHETTFSYPRGEHPTRERRRVVLL